jgi:hypothetical protein
MRYEAPKVKPKDLPTKIDLLEEQKKQIDREIYLERYVKSLSNGELLILYNDIEQWANETYHWNFDEQQADPIHKIVCPEDIVKEYHHRFKELLRKKK